MSAGSTGPLAARLRALVEKASDQQLALALFLFALAVRLAIVARLGGGSVEGYENAAIARSILAGHGYSFELLGSTVTTAHQYPLYTFFLLAHWWLAGHEAWLPVQVSQAFVGALAVPLLFVVGRDLLDRATGLLAAALLTVYPVHAYYTVRGQSLILEVTLLLALVALCWRARDELRWRPWILVGVLLGVSILAKTLYLIFVGPFAVWVALSSRLAARQLAARFGALVVVALLVVLPWSIRNTLSLGRFYLVSSNGGFNLWCGNNPNATGSIFAANRQHMATTLDQDLKQQLAAADDKGKDALLREAALRWIRENPGRFLALIPARMRCLWWFDPYMDTSYGGLRERLYVVVLALALPGFWITRKRWKEMSIWYLLALTTSAVYAAYYGGARFRYLLEPGLLLLPAAACLLAIAARLSRLFAHAQRVEASRGGGSALSPAK